jgi:hypothetical protein
LAASVRAIAMPMRVSTLLMWRIGTGADVAVELLPVASSTNASPTTWPRERSSKVVWAARFGRG